ncbi:SNARE-binding exocyst [Salix suchowensis]|nr:SNARE-binding exocyst [Salix suchowensis]
MQANARVIKHYRSKITKAITESIKAKFEDAYLESEGWLYQDIIRVESTWFPVFLLNMTSTPSSSRVPQGSGRHHQETGAGRSRGRRTLNTPRLAKGVQEEYEGTEIPPELLEPPLFDGKEQSLIEDYLNLIVKKLDEWSANLMKTEINDFVTRAEPPELDADNLYGTQGAIILFQMVNQQIDLATESGQGAILASVVGETNRVMRSIQDQWVKIVEAEFKKQVEKPEEVSGGLVEYLIALANDQFKSADNAEILLSRLEPLVSEKYRVQITEKLNDAIEGYLDVTNKCTQTLVDMIFNDLKPATKQLFQPTWYDGSLMNQIVETMRDYMSDYQSYLHPSLVETTVDELIQAFLLTYFNALANSPKLKIPAATSA